MKRLILNADDYGANDFIDTGILKGIEGGVVNSVSVLVNFPGAEERVKKLLAHPHANSVKVGLHLSITSGFTDEVDQYRTLNVPGTNKFPLMRDIRVGIISQSELKTEITRQIEKLGRFLGGVQKIDHINSHYGIFFMHPLLENAFLEVLETYKNRANDSVRFNLRSPLTWSKSGLVYYKVPWRMLFIQRKAIKEGISRSLLYHQRFSSAVELLKGTKLKHVKKVLKRFKKQGYDMPFCFIDQYFGRADDFTLKKIIEYLPEDRVVEFMLHLGDGTFDYEEDSSYGIDYTHYANRAVELEVLLRNRNLLRAVKHVHYDPASW